MAEKQKYRDITHLAAVLHPLGVNVESAQLIRSNTNLVYDCGDRILRLTPATVRDRVDVQTEIDWLTFLGREGVNVVQVLGGGEPIELAIEQEVFWGICFKKIQGAKIAADQWKTAHFEGLGDLLGQLHKIGKGYPIRSDLSYRHWDEIPEFYSFEYFPDDNRQLRRLHNEVVHELKRLPQETANYGLIHYDVHHGNYLLTSEQKIVLFDFELVCQSWYIHDVATVLYYACNHPATKQYRSFNELFLSHFWLGYEQHHQISEMEKEKIPLFLLYRDLMVYGYLLQIWGNKELSQQEQAYKARVESSIAARRMILDG